MRILVTNDDGIFAPGLVALRQVAALAGEVCVVAPTTAQSAVGHAITLTDPVRARQVDLGDGTTGTSVEGRPADCVKLALLELMPRRPDLVVSGVNLGLNSGINVLYSGTVAAAVEGAFFGVPAVAVSIEDADRVDFPQAARLAWRVIEQWWARQERPILLNINIPDLTPGPPRGVRVVQQSLKGWREGWDRRLDPRGRTYYWMTGDREPEDEGVASDVASLAQRYVTVTPLRFDLTDHRRMADMEGWGLTL
jgi:5'-nucleotidase